ncbi:MAG: VCBS repeat-containing protein [Sedimentisphaerales bacterium]|nr:VCBS repeat-containing protein [Sedimentisphaerales bacterium]
MNFKILFFSGLLALLVPGGPAGLAQTEDLSEYFGFGEIDIVKLDWDIRSLTIADFNGDGLTDIVAANNRKSRIDLLLQRPNTQSELARVHSQLQSTGTLEPDDVNFLAPSAAFERQEILTTVKIGSLAAGDFNADGRTDLVYYGQPEGLYILFQEPTSGAVVRFSERDKRRVDDGLMTPGALACGDINADGKADIVLAGRNSIYLFLQKADGDLDSPRRLATTAATLAVRLGDLDGDGRKDLVLITDDKERPLHIMPGLADGRLGPQLRLRIEPPSAVELADYDGLPGDEILTVEQASGRLSTYKLTRLNDADKDWPALVYPLEVTANSRNRDLIAADFDGDGLSDVVVSNPDAAEILFYRQMEGIGLDQPRRFPTYADVSALDAADLDNDGKAELAVLSVKEKAVGISRYENDRLVFPTTISTEGDPVGMCLGNIGGNRSIDCVCIVNQNGKFAMHVVYGAGQATPVPMPAAALTELNSAPEGVRIADVDRNGLADILIFRKFESPLLVQQNAGATFAVVPSAFAQMSLIKDARLSTFAPLPDGKEGEGTILVARDNFARSLLFEGGNHWSVIEQFNAARTDDKVAALAAIDLDGDQTREILLLNASDGRLEILKGAPGSMYTLDRQIEIGKWNQTGHLKMLAAPLLGDTTPTLLVFDADKFALLPLSDSRHNTEAWRIQKQFSYETRIRDGAYARLACGDINSDDVADLVMVEYKKKHLEILTFRNGDTEKTPVPGLRFRMFEEKSFQEESPAQNIVEPRELLIADVTGDGAADLVTIIHDRIIVYPQDF